MRPSGKHLLEVEAALNKSYTQPDGKTEHVINNFSAVVMRGDKVVLVGRNGQGKTTMLKAMLANAPGSMSPRPRTSTPAPSMGSRGADRLLPAGPQGLHPAGHDRRRLAAPVRPGRLTPGRHPRPARPDAVQRRRGQQEDRRALGWRNRTPALLQASCCRSPTSSSSTSPRTISTSRASTRSTRPFRSIEGTVFLVTHDQDLIEEVGTRIWHFEGGPDDFRITDHKGPYEEYQQQLALAAK